MHPHKVLVERLSVGSVARSHGLSGNTVAGSLHRGGGRLRVEE
jgi:hypothetical protein